MPDRGPILFVDDEAAMRQAVTQWLELAGFTLMAHDSAARAAGALSADFPGVLVTDLKMEGMDGLELLRRSKVMGVDDPVIVITGHGDIALAVEAMKFGAVDFLEKPFDDEMILGSVRSALSKDADSTRQKAQYAEINEKLAALSNRERQVLEGLVAGKANKVIAYDLGISPRTVEIYRANLMTKMGAGSLSELVRMAMTVGILKPDTDRPR